MLTASNSPWVLDMILDKPKALSWSALLLVGMSLAAPAFADPVAKLMFAIRSVEIERASGVTEPGAKGSALNQGDQVRTGSDGRAQILFIDGARVALKPDTVFVIESYEAPSQDNASLVAVAGAGSGKAVLNMLQGGMRAISGSITKSNPDGMSVNTPVATMGIRGTVFKAALSTPSAPSEDAVSSQATLAVAVTDGQVRVSNDNGSVDVNPGEFAVVDAGSAPTLTAKQPDSLAGGDESDEEGEEQEEDSEESADGEAQQEEQQEEQQNQDSENEESGQDESGDSASDNDDDAGGESAANESADGESAEGDRQAKTEKSDQDRGDKNDSGNESAAGDGDREANNASGGGSAGGSSSSTTSSAESTEGSAGGSSSANASSPTAAGPAPASNSSSTGAPTPPPTEPSAPENPPTASGGTNLENPEAVEQQLGAVRQFAASFSHANLASGYELANGQSAAVNTDINNAGEARKFAAKSVPPDQQAPITVRYSIAGENGPTAQVLEKGADPATGFEWGRWTTGSFDASPAANGTDQSYSLAGQRSLHWLYSSEIQGRPLSGITASASYRLVGSTSPTDIEGHVGVLGVADLSANFDTRQLSLNLQLAINNQNWNANGTAAMQDDALLPFAGGLSGQAVGQGPAELGTVTGQFAGSFSPNVITVNNQAVPAGAGFSYGLAASGGITNVVTGVAIVGNPSVQGGAP